jgi:ABC-2 type transport system permease protein
MRRRYDMSPDAGRSFESFSDFLISIFLSIVIPLCAVAFGTSGLASEREDRTLMLILMRPIPRPLVLAARWLASLPLGLGMVVASFYAYCWLAGSIGAAARELYLPAIFWTTFAYLGLFQLLAVTFRHATIVALAYAVFVEMILGAMPGIIKCVAVNYYGRSLMYTAGAEEGLSPPDPRWFEPIAVSTATWSLVGVGLGALALAVIVFQCRDYADG